MTMAIPTRPPGSRPAAETGADQKAARPHEDARRVDAEEALERLLRFLETRASARPSPKLPAPQRNVATVNPARKGPAAAPLQVPASAPPPRVLAAARPNPPAAAPLLNLPASNRPSEGASLGSVVPRAAQADRSLVPPAVEPPSRRRRGRRVSKVVLLALVSAGALFALGDVDDLMKRLIAVAPAVRPAATPPSLEETSRGPGAGVSPLMKQDELGLRGVTSAGPPPLPAGAPFDNLPSAKPGGESRKAPAEAPPQPQAPDIGPDRTESVKTKSAPIAAQISSATEGASASEAVKAPAGPPFDSVPSAGPSGDARKAPAEAAPQPQAPDLGPGRTESVKTNSPPIAAQASSATEGASASQAVKASAQPERHAVGSAQRRETQTQPAQPGSTQRLGEAAKRKAIAVDEAPMPPTRPEHEKHRKHERTARHHRAEQAEAPEPAFPPAAEPETPAAQPSGNALMRAVGDTFK